MAKSFKGGMTGVVVIEITVYLGENEVLVVLEVDYEDGMVSGSLIFASRYHEKRLSLSEQ